MNETPKNREWVKNAAIVFLAVLLVLTFFSNTIMNRSLPEVATQDVTDGAIVSKVRGSGTVTANGNNQVKMEKTRVIRAVLVKSGQEVKAGDVLFTLGEGSSEEIEALEEKIRNLQNSYNRTAVILDGINSGKGAFSRCNGSGKYQNVLSGDSGDKIIPEHHLSA